MLIFPDPSDSTKYTDPNGSVWQFNGTGWVRQPDCPDGGGDGGIDILNQSCFQIRYQSAGYSIGGDAENHPMVLRDGDFTLQWWVKTSQGKFSLFNPHYAKNASGYFGVWVNNSTLYLSNSAPNTSLWTWSASSIVDRLWHHIRICRESGVYYLYVDGINKSGEISGSRNDSTNLVAIPTKGTFWGAESAGLPQASTRYAGIQIVRGFSMGLPEKLEIRKPFEPCKEDGADNLLCVNVTADVGYDLVDIGEYANPLAVNDTDTTALIEDTPYAWNPPMRMFNQEEWEAEFGVEEKSE